MNIKTFKKLAAIKDEALQNYALFQLLNVEFDSTEEEGGDKFAYYKPLTGFYAEKDAVFQEQYLELILDLIEITREDFERLIEFCSTNDMILDNGLQEYLEVMDIDGLALPFEVFKPLAKSHTFRDIFNIHSVTGEIFTRLEWDLDVTSERIFEQLEMIIEFRLDNLTA